MSFKRRFGNQQGKLYIVRLMQLTNVAFKKNYSLYNYKCEDVEIKIREFHEISEMHTQIP